MSTFRLLTPEQAAAVRRIAPSYGVANPDLVIRQAGLAKTVGEPARRVRLRIGHPPAHVPPDRFGEVFYCTRKPRCRECGGLLETGPAIMFGAFPVDVDAARSMVDVLGVRSFLHLNACPKEDA